MRNEEESMSKTVVKTTLGRGEYVIRRESCTPLKVCVRFGDDRLRVRHLIR